MIKSAKTDFENFQSILNGDSFLAKKLNCEYKSLKDLSPVNFYTINKGAFLTLGSNLSLCGALDLEDIEELMAFCKFMGVDTIECQGVNLPVTSKSTASVLQYMGQGEHPLPIVCKNPNIYEFSKFCCENFEEIEFDIVYSYFARKVNKGLSNIYCIQEGDKFICGGIATDYGGDTLYLTFVSTGKNFRGRGLARGLIQYITKENENKKVVLMCEDELITFYTKLGFKPTDQVTIYSLRKDII